MCGGDSTVGSNPTATACDCPLRSRPSRGSEGVFSFGFRYSRQSSSNTDPVLRHETLLVRLLGDGVEDARRLSVNGMEILFVHGAFVRDGAWWWRRAAEAIERATGVTSRAVALPSCGEGVDAAAGAGLLEDAAALHRELDRVDSAVIVAHSYGGTVAAQGADHAAVRHLVYISSYLPEVGDSEASVTAGQPDPVPVRDDRDGTVSVVSDDRDSFGARFWGDVDDADVRVSAFERLVPQSVAAFGTPTTKAAWRTVESTYLVCADDRSCRRATIPFCRDRI